MAPMAMPFQHADTNNKNLGDPTSSRDALPSPKRQNLESKMLFNYTTLEFLRLLIHNLNKALNFASSLHCSNQRVDYFIQTNLP